MRIALVVPHLEPGGVENSLFRLGPCLQRAGHSVTIVSTEQEGKWWGVAQEMGLDTRCLPILPTSPPIAHALKVANFLTKGGYDVIFLHHARYAQASLSRLPKHVIAVPVIHSGHAEVCRIGCANRWAWNAAVAVSPRVYQETLSRVPGRPVLLIPNGVEMPKGSDWSRRQMLQGQLRLLFVGRLDHFHKGVLLLPEILKACRQRGIDASLTVVGEGEDGERMQSKIGEYGLQGLVNWRGLLPPQDIYEVMLSHHVLLMPSFFEGLPNVVLEAQACGCVPVVSRLPGITDFLIRPDLTGRLEEPGEVRGFVESVESLYRRPELWASMSRAGHLQVEREFSLEVMRRAYLRLMEEALAGRYPLPRPRWRGVPVDPSLFSWREHFFPLARRIRRFLFPWRQRRA